MSDKSQHKKLFTSSIITVLIVIILLLSGPANAVVVSISGLDGATIQQSNSKSFTVSVTLESFDQYVPIDSMSLNLTGPVNKTWTFNIATGDIISPSGDQNVSINVINAPDASYYGYGYGNGSGYGADTGYGYGLFGYGYGYGYDHGAGGADVTFTYNITLDTTYLDVGVYTAQVHVNTGSSVKPRFSSSTATFTITSPPLGAPNIISFSPSSPVESNVSEPVTFSVKANQTVNMAWYFNGALEQTNSSVTSANYTKTTNLIGVHNVTVVASNANGTDSKTWEWNVVPGGMLYFSAGSLTVNEGASGTTSLYLNNSNNIGSFDVNVTFNPDVGMVTDITKGSAIEHLVSNINNASGIVRLGGFNLNTSLNGNVKIADIIMQANGTQGSSTVLGLAVNSIANASAVPVTQFGIQNGSFRIKDTTNPIINTVSLNRSSVFYSEPVLVTVNTSDNVGVTSVVANDGNSSVYLSLTSGSNVSGIWDGTIIAPSALGTRTVSVTAYDAEGNSVLNTSQSYTVIDDGLSPSVNIYSPDNNSTTNIFDRSGVSGSITDVSGITASMELNGVLTNSWTFKGNFSWNVNYTVGQNIINVSATDAGGNYNESIIVVNVLSPSVTKNVSIGANNSTFVPANTSSGVDVELFAGSNNANVSLSINASTNASELNATDLSTDIALGQNQKSLNRFVHINVTGDVNNLSRVNLTVYYSIEDLDRNGDGDADDPGDIKERILIYPTFFNQF